MGALLIKSLGVVCPSCDFLNVVGAVRCMSCGAATEGVTATRLPTKPVAAVAPPPHFADSENEGPTLSAAPAAATPGPLDAPSSPAGPPGLKRSHPSLAPVPAPAPKPAPPAASAAGPKLGLTVVSGSARGQRFRLAATGAQIGRSRGAILFPDDASVSPLHATLTLHDGRLYVRDEGSPSGVYATIAAGEPLMDGDTFAVGQRRFRYVGAIQPAEPWNRLDVLVYGAPLPNNQVHYALEEVLLGDRPGRCLLVSGPVVTIGQGRCDFAYPSDEGLAPRHCEITVQPSGAMLRDLSGGLGTFVRIAGERALKPGDRLRVGGQVLQVEALA